MHSQEEPALILKDLSTIVKIKKYTVLVLGLVELIMIVSEIGKFVKPSCS